MRAPKWMLRWQTVFFMTCGWFCGVFFIYKGYTCLLRRYVFYEVFYEDSFYEDSFPTHFNPITDPGSTKLGPGSVVGLNVSYTFLYDPNLGKESFSRSREV